MNSRISSPWRAVAAVLWLQSGCLPLGEPEDCYEGMAVGRTVDLRLVAEYDESGPYRYQNIGGFEDFPSCAAVDSLDVGTHEFRLIERRGTGASDGCNNYLAVPLAEFEGVDFSEPRILGGVISAQARFRSGIWRFSVLRFTGQDRNPFDESAIEGQLPPVVARRIIEPVGEPACFDEWVGEVRVVDGAGDAGR